MYSKISNKIDIDVKFLEENFLKFNEDILKFKKILKHKNFLIDSDFIESEKEFINFETNNHHMGGLYIGREKSPVDQNFRLRGFNNLYITGSGLLEKSGLSGPTLTIIALSHILGKKINLEN